MGEMKKAMPFVQGLKKRLVGGEKPETVFNRQLAFDELKTLENMVPGLKKAAGLAVVEVVQVEEGGKKGLVVGTEKVVEGLPPNADAAVPGVPTFNFENVEV
jgi:leucyl-tRNA synthetase